VLRHDLYQVTCRLEQSRKAGKLDSGNLSKKARGDAGSWSFIGRGRRERWSVGNFLQLLNRPRLIANADYLAFSPMRFLTRV
jgi:hypothetical protein